MAYYSSSYHDYYFGESYQTPYCGNYDIVPSQVLMADSGHEFSNQNFSEYNPTPYYDAYDSARNHSVIAYSISTFSQPKSVVYDLYSGDYNPALTQFRIYYSTSDSEFNEPEFEEYDPTPYGGGYDLALTYGKPLSPSDELCYPRSVLDSTAVSLNGVTLGSTESPYGKKDVDEFTARPHIESKQAPSNEDKQQFDATSGDGLNKEYDNTHGSSSGKSLDLYQGEDVHGDNCEDNPPWPNHESRSNEDNSCEYDNRVTQIPSGYGLEAMDLCESIFGYWPCLARYNKGDHDCQEVGNEGSSSNQWTETADYLFGSSNPYGERRDAGASYGDLIYNCERHYQEQHVYRRVKYDERHHQEQPVYRQVEYDERHYQEQPLYRQVEYDEDSWMQKFKIF